MRFFRLNRVHFFILGPERFLLLSHVGTGFWSILWKKCTVWQNRASLVGRSTEQKTCDLAGEQFKNAKENIKRGFKETGNSLYGMSTYHLLDGNGSTKRSMTWRKNLYSTISKVTALIQSEAFLRYDGFTVNTLGYWWHSSIAVGQIAAYRMTSSFVKELGKQTTVEGNEHVEFQAQKHHLKAERQSAEITVPSSPWSSQRLI